MKRPEWLKARTMFAGCYLYGDEVRGKWFARALPLTAVVEVEQGEGEISLGRVMTRGPLKAKRPTVVCRLRLVSDDGLWEQLVIGTGGESGLARQVAAEINARSAELRDTQQ